jgi:hypothetical protein
MRKMNDPNGRLLSLVHWACCERYEVFRLPKDSFHLSLAVLLHYRSPKNIKPCKVILADSHGIYARPLKFL